MRLVALMASLLAAAGSAPVAAQPDRWLRVGATDDAEVYMDTHTIARDGLSVTYWIRFDYARPQTGSRGRYNVSLNQRRDNCSRRTTRLLAIIDRLDDAVVDSLHNLGSEERAIPPESVGEAVMSLACAGR